MSKHSKHIVIATSTYTPDIGGMSTYAQTIANALVKDNIVTVITYSSSWSYISEKQSNYKVIRIYKGLPKPFRQLWYLIRLFFVSLSCHVIYALGTGGAGMPTAIVSKITNKPYVLRISGDRVWEGAMVQGKINVMIDEFQAIPKKGWIAMLWHLQSWVARGAKINIAHSNYLKQILIGWEVDQETIQVIYTGIERKRSDLIKEQARQKIGVQGKIILSAGRLVPWKGFGLLIKLMPRLLSLDPFLRLVILGDGPEQKRLETIVTNMGLKTKVHIVGKKQGQELIDYYVASDYFVLNTGYEGLSHMILEAMDMKLPIITTEVGGNPEVIEQGINGFLVQYNDEFNMFESIKTLIHNPELRDKFIKKGEETVKIFSVKNMCDQTVELLENV